MKIGIGLPHLDLQRTSPSLPVSFIEISDPVWATPNHSCTYAILPYDYCNYHRLLYFIVITTDYYIIIVITTDYYIIIVLVKSAKCQTLKFISFLIGYFNECSVKYVDLRVDGEHLSTIISHAFCIRFCIITCLNSCHEYMCNIIYFKALILYSVFRFTTYQLKIY